MSKRPRNFKDKKPYQKVLRVPLADEDGADESCGSGEENGVENLCESDSPRGAKRPVRILTIADFGNDPITFALYHQSYVFELMQKMRKAADQRKFAELPGFADEHAEWLQAAPKHLRWMENKASGELSKTLRQHILWPWLSQFPGLGGHHVARILAMIKNPNNFPKKDHRGTGVRAISAYFGLHVDSEGRLPRARKGVQSNWKAAGRTALLQPMGIVDAIIMHRVPHYSDIYYRTKARLEEERGYVDVPPADVQGERYSAFIAAYRRQHPRTPTGPLFRGELDRTARTIVAKRFLGDLLMAWKRAIAQHNMAKGAELTAESGNGSGADNRNESDFADGAEIRAERETEHGAECTHASDVRGGADNRPESEGTRGASDHQE